MLNINKTKFNASLSLYTFKTIWIVILINFPYMMGGASFNLLVYYFINLSTQSMKHWY